MRLEPVASPAVVSGRLKGCGFKGLRASERLHLDHPAVQHALGQRHAHVVDALPVERTEGEGEGHGVAADQRIDEAGIGSVLLSRRRDEVGPGVLGLDRGQVVADARRVEVPRRAAARKVVVMDADDRREPVGRQRDAGDAVG